MPGLGGARYRAENETEESLGSYILVWKVEGTSKKSRLRYDRNMREVEGRGAATLDTEVRETVVV